MVLVAEDEPALRQLFAQALRSAGFGVIAAADGAEALALAAAHVGSIRLLVSDVRMPRLDGFELADRLRRVRPWLKVLFVSGHADQTPGGEPMLAKPFRMGELVAAVELVLGAG